MRCSDVPGRLQHSAPSHWQALPVLPIPCGAAGRSRETLLGKQPEWRTRNSDKLKAGAAVPGIDPTAAALQSPSLGGEKQVGSQDHRLPLPDHLPTWARRKLLGTCSLSCLCPEELISS